MTKTDTFLCFLSLSAVVAVAIANPAQPVQQAEVTNALPEVVPILHTDVPVAPASVEAVPANNVLVQNVLGPDVVPASSEKRRTKYETWYKGNIVASFDVEYSCGTINCSLPKGSTLAFIPEKGGAVMRQVPMSAAEMYRNLSQEAKEYPIVFAYTD